MPTVEEAPLRCRADVFAQHLHDVEPFLLVAFVAVRLADFRRADAAEPAADRAAVGELDRQRRVDDVVVVAAVLHRGARDLALAPGAETRLVGAALFLDLAAPVRLRRDERAIGRHRRMQRKFFLLRFDGVHVIPQRADEIGVDVDGEVAHGLFRIGLHRLPERLRARPPLEHAFHLAERDRDMLGFAGIVVVMKGCCSHFGTLLSHQ
jgi:hypothetical protein